MTKEILIASTIDGTREFIFKVGKETQIKRFEKGRTLITEEEFEALKKNKGFAILLKNDCFSEPASNDVKHDAAVDELKDGHEAAIEKLVEGHEKDLAIAIAMKDDELSNQKVGYEKQLERANSDFIKSETELKKVKDELALLKKGKNKAKQ